MPGTMFEKNYARKGFTLIELLVVIAIIAILAAILFPVFNTMRENVRKTECMGKMHEVYRALQLYKLDNNKYPPVLYGYAELANGTFYTGVGSPVPMPNIQQRPLFKGQKYLKDNTFYFCSDNIPQILTDVTTAVYPTGPGVTLAGTVPNVVSGATPAYFYKSDSYDVGPQVDKNGIVVLSAGKPVIEAHYSLSWTNTTGPGDNPNQLKYPTPDADHTVVTWCTYHVAVAHSNTIPVILLSGTVKPVPTDQFVNQGPLNFKF